MGHAIYRKHPYNEIGRSFVWVPPLRSFLYWAQTSASAPPSRVPCTECDPTLVLRDLSAHSGASVSLCREHNLPLVMRVGGN